MTTVDDVTALATRAHHWAPKLKALADENRLTIALLLAEREFSVKELQDATGLSQTLVSHHLKLLRDQRLVTVRIAGRSNHYSLCCDDLDSVIEAIARTSHRPCG